MTIKSMLWTVVGVAGGVAVWLIGCSSPAARPSEDGTREVHSVRRSTGEQDPAAGKPLGTVGQGRYKQLQSDVPGAVVAARPVGVLIMEDEAGLDEKILAVPAHRLTKFYDTVKDYKDLPEILLHRIDHFFEQYKALEPNKWVKVRGWEDADSAKRIILKGIEKYTQKAA